jgi:hypothetical protein
MVPGRIRRYEGGDSEAAVLTQAKARVGHHVFRQPLFHKRNMKDNICNSVLYAGKSLPDRTKIKKSQPF